ncbi:glycosyltransferase [Bdellovibrio bacteriovorus]|uniref:glycosyltransferase n=1 Tax=Bdellovibrio bacteriovorus TaxID=959 RepID=UPI0035A951E7
MKHLVFLTEHLSFGGAERALVEYLSSIDRTKYKVSLILRDDKGAENYLLSSVPKDVEVKVIYKQQSEGEGLLKRSFKKMLPKLDLTLRVHKALRELGPCDLLLDFTSVLLKQAHFFYNYKKVYWIHGPKTHMGPAELKKFSLRLRSYDLVAVVSDHLKAEIEYLLPHITKKLACIYNPFDIDRILKSGKDESELSKEDRVLINQPYILAVGRFAVEKDYITLISTYKKLKDRSVGFKLYIIGEGPGRSEIEQKIREEGLQDDVILLGAKKNPYIWMKNSLLFVHSARVEGFGLVIVEAMILGKAVVVTDSPGGPHEILDGGKFGKLVPVGDSQAMAEAIKELVDNSELRVRAQNLSLERAQDFSVSKLLPDFYKILETFPRS